MIPANREKTKLIVPPQGSSQRSPQYLGCPGLLTNEALQKRHPNVYVVPDLKEHPNRDKLKPTCQPQRHKVSEALTSAWTVRGWVSQS